MSYDLLEAAVYSSELLSEEEKQAIFACLKTGKIDVKVLPLIQKALTGRIRQIDEEIADIDSVLGDVSTDIDSAQSTADTLTRSASQEVEAKMNDVTNQFESDVEHLENMTIAKLESDFGKKDIDEALRLKQSLSS